MKKGLMHGKLELEKRSVISRMTKWGVNDESEHIATPKSSFDCGFWYVRDLMIKHELVWDRNFSSKLFKSRDFKAIENILLSNKLLLDKQSWAFTRGGRYSVQSGCLLGLSVLVDSLDETWLKLIEVKAIPKVSFLYGEYIQCCSPHTS